MTRIYNLLTISALTMGACIASAQTTDGSVPVIDKSQSITDVVARNPKLQTLSHLLKRSGLGEMLKKNGSKGIGYTFFAPTDHAWDAVSPKLMDKLYTDSDLLMKLLRYHVVSQPMVVASFINGEKIRTMEKEDIDVKTGDNGQILVDGASILNKDVHAENGTIDIVDVVLLPPSMK